MHLFKRLFCIIRRNATIGQVDFSTQLLAAINTGAHWATLLVSCLGFKPSQKTLNGTISL